MKFSSNIASNFITPGSDGCRALNNALCRSIDRKYMYFASLSFGITVRLVTQKLNQTPYFILRLVHIFIAVGFLMVLLFSIRFSVG